MRRHHIVLATAAVSLLAAMGGVRWQSRSILPSAGGLYFPCELILPVPHFCQGDPRWGEALLGPTAASLRDEGCAIASAAMVLASYEIDIDPGRLNQFLHGLPGGYTDRGWIEWFKAAECAPHLLSELLPHYEDLPSYYLIDINLLVGNPLIVRLRSSRNTTHFMVIVGKRGFEYLALDPGKSSQDPFPLSEYGSDIEALRFYQKPTSVDSKDVLIKQFVSPHMFRGTDPHFPPGQEFADNSQTAEKLIVL